MFFRLVVPSLLLATACTTAVGPAPSDELSPDLGLEAKADLGRGVTRFDHIAYDRATAGRFVDDYEVHAYPFDVRSGGAVRARISAEAAVRPLLAIYDAAEDRVAEGRDRDLVLDHTATSSGRYFVVVATERGNGRGTYDLTLSCTNGRCGGSWSSDANVIEECARVMPNAEYARQCIGHAARAPRDPVPVIDACNDAMPNYLYTLRCLDAYVASPMASAESVRTCQSTMPNYDYTLRCLAKVAMTEYEAAPMVNACNVAMPNYEYTLRCIDELAPASEDPSASVPACQSAMPNYEYTLRCLDSVGSASFAPALAIAACNAAMPNYDYTLRCLGVAVRAPREPSDVIDACSRTTPSYVQALACLEAAFPE